MLRDLCVVRRRWMDGEDFEHAVAVDGNLVIGQLLQDREHHVLLAQRGSVLDIETFRVRQQIGRCLGLKISEMHSDYALGGQRKRGVSVHLVT